MDDFLIEKVALAIFSATYHGAKEFSAYTNKGLWRKRAIAAIEAVKQHEYRDIEK